jgi:hypothetical protein
MIVMAHHLGEDQLTHGSSPLADPVGRPGCGEHSGPEAVARGGRRR